VTWTIRSNMRRIRTVLREVVKGMSTQWEELENVLMRVLNLFPEARAAVVAAFREVLGRNDSEGLRPDVPGGFHTPEIRV
jgi:hypothetical protein